MKLDIEEIRTRLPHRYPFLLVDRVVSVEPGERIEAYKNLTINEPFLTGISQAKRCSQASYYWRQWRRLLAY